MLGGRMAALRGCWFQAQAIFPSPQWRASIDRSPWKTDMRRHLALASSLAVLGAALAAIGLPGSVAAPTADLRAAQRTDGIPVDVELVLAVDVSYSMDLDELALQREGYAQAVASRDFMSALKQGTHGKVAITYFEWAGANDQKVIVPWRVIDGPEAADAVAAEISKSPIRRASRTSISGALQFGQQLFNESPYRGIRRVIDVSGDGPNNSGGLVELTRDELVKNGITINGLPLLLKRPNFSTMDIVDLDIYYEDCVIGGPGAFVVPVREHARFTEAIRTKLVLEVAQRPADGKMIPVQAKQPRVSCTIGERLWQQRWGN
jgi:hypothetical protein